HVLAVGAVEVVVQVGAADPDVLHAQTDLLGTGLDLGPVLQTDVLGGVDGQCLHVSAPSEVVGRARCRGRGSVGGSRCSRRDGGAVTAGTGPASGALKGPSGRSGGLGGLDRLLGGGQRAGGDDDAQQLADPVDERVLL